MSCCGHVADTVRPVSRRAGRSGESVRLDLIVPGIHCAGCIAKIEDAVGAVPGVGNARVNLSTRRLSVVMDGAGDPEEIVRTVEALGYDCRRYDPHAAGAQQEDRRGRELLRALAVAGFAAGNVMLLSVSVWSGAEGATRDLFHWISALIALPAILYAGRPFFGSAWQALKARTLNMDVPISLAVVLAAALSLHATLLSGEEAFFDAAVMLLFFLLLGRYLDHRVRARARATVSQLLSLWSTEATRLTPAGQERVAVDDLAPGDRLLVAAGERIPVDGVVVEGAADLDCAIVTGESQPVAAGPGATVRAGTMPVTRPLTIRATAVGDDTFLAQVVRLMEEAENGRARYVRLADRAAQVYAPAVHLIALLTFIGWMVVTGGDWSHALWIAVSVLIITCPCALGLAVPAVQVVASGVLFAKGILVKDGTALERMAQSDRAVFDKTGTLTTGRPRIVRATLDEANLALAAALARQSRHPLALALAAHAGPNAGAEADAVEEHPGEGLSGCVSGHELRLGRRAFAGPAEGGAPGATELWLMVDGRPAGHVEFEDALRPGAAAMVAELDGLGFRPMLLSGDNAAAVARTAAEAGIEDWRAGQQPGDKIAALQALADEGHRTMMVGDGINDGPALAAAHVSMAPASASDVGRAAADFVFLHDGLDAVTVALAVSRKARRLILQNFGLALIYNLIAIPIAVLGGASPLVAAIAMSSSSVVVTLNALRLRLGEGRNRKPANTAVTTVREARA